MNLKADTKLLERTLIAALSGATEQMNADKDACEIFASLKNEDFTDKDAISLFLAMKEAHGLGKSIAYDEFSLSLVGTDLLQAFNEIGDIKFDCRPKEYARQLKEHSARRQFDRALSLVKEDMSKGAPVREAMEKHICPLTETENPFADRKAFEAQPLDQALTELSDMYSRMNVGTWEDSNCVPTGFARIDSALKGGFKPSQLIIIGARPATGKTAFALEMAFNIAQRPEKGKVLFVSLEMTSRELAARLAARKSGHGTPDCKNNADHLKRTNPSAIKELEEATEHLKELPILIIERALSISSLCSEIRKTFKKEREKIQCVFVDYLGLIPSDGKKVNSYESTTEISKKFKPLAKELGVPVIVLSQLSRNSEKENRPPAVSDLRDSGQIEQDADIVFLLSDDLKETETERAERETEHPSSKKLLIKIAKHRNGQTTQFPAVFIGRTNTFKM